MVQPGCLWVTSTDASSLSPTESLLLALVLWITLLYLKINTGQTGDGGRNKAFCISVPVVERSGSKREGAEEFHWFEFFFFLNYHWPKKPSLDSFKPQQAQVSMGLEKLHRVRRVLHTQMQEGKIFCFSDKKLMESKEAGGRGNGGNHVPKYLVWSSWETIFSG